MRDINRLLRNALTVSFFLLLSWAGIGTTVQAQGRMTIQATAMGASTQMGKIYNVNILIEQFSTPSDRKALIDAFARSGKDGLVDVLEEMKPKRRVRFANGSVGNDVKYIMELPSGERAPIPSSDRSQPCLRRTVRGYSFQGLHCRRHRVGPTPDGKAPAQCCQHASDGG
jgi:hypothetical protein